MIWRMIRALKLATKIRTHEGDSSIVMVKCDSAASAADLLTFMNKIANVKDGAFFFDQLAFRPSDMKRAKALLSTIGVEKFQNDVVKTTGEVDGESTEGTQADLSFNYDLGPVEFELIEYLEGANWLHNRDPSGKPLAAHLGMHVDSVDKWCKKLEALGLTVIQRMKSVAHSSPDIPKGRSYTYAIVRTHDLLGVDLKLIERSGGAA